MILAILTAILAYRKAKETGRNAPLWAIAGAVVYIGTQLVVSIGIGLLLGLGQILWGWPDTVYETYEIFVTIVAIAASLLASWILLRFMDRRPASESTFQDPPPPPPSFDRGQ